MHKRMVLFWLFFPVALQHFMDDTNLHLAIGFGASTLIGPTRYNMSLAIDIAQYSIIWMIMQSIGSFSLRQ